MPLTPLEIQKMRFNQRMRGYDPTEVESFLSLLAEEMTARLTQVEKLERRTAITASAWRRRSRGSTSSSRPCCGRRRCRTRSWPTPAARRS